MKKSIIRIISFCIILACVLSYTDKVLRVKYGDGIYGCTKFYELENNTVDVLMLGSSHAFENFNTGVFWNEYGMSSFILAGSMQPMWNTYYYLKEALKSQKPQLIVLEGYMLKFSSEYSDDSRIIKNNYGLKWSKDKVDAIKISSPKDRWDEFLLEYTQYHTRYRELSRGDFYENQGNPLYVDWKGFGCNMATMPTEAVDVAAVNERCSLNEKTEKYYRMTIELAQANNIPMLVVISPYAKISEDDQSIFNMAGDIANEYGVPFVNYNLLIKDIGIDYSMDAADMSHLNYRGSQKYSLAVGKYIKDNFDISDHRGDPNYQTWQNDADYISTMIKNQLLLETSNKGEIAKKILAPNYVLIISVDGSCRLDDVDLRNFWNAIGISADSVGIGVCYKENDKGMLYYIRDEGEKQYVRLDHHDLCMKRENDAPGGTYMNYIIIDQIEYKKVTNGINIVVYDRITQAVIDSFGLNSDDSFKIVR